MVMPTAVGLTNQAWMAAIAVAVPLEKTWPHGRGLSRPVGAALTAFAGLVPVNPSLVPDLHAPLQMPAAASRVRVA